jgi:drug/metabolite transporter (DMT)-like permease
MPTILLATAASVLFGFSDYFGGLASRRDSAFAVTATAHVVGLLVAALGMLVIPSQPTTADLWWGAGVGLSGGIGVVSLYAGLARGRMSIVAPVTAALSGSLPALYDLATGTELRPLSLAALGLAVVAIVIVSQSGHPEDRAEMPWQATALSILAGVAFAFSITLLSFTRTESGMAPLLVARIVSAPLMLAITFVRMRKIGINPEARSHALGAGALDMAANVAIMSAVRIGPLATASVLGSLYPVTTILLARAFLGERLHRRQAIGVGIALIAIILSAAR